MKFQTAADFSAYHVQQFTAYCAALRHAGASCRPRRTGRWPNGSTITDQARAWVQTQTGAFTAAEAQAALNGVKLRTVNAILHDLVEAGALAPAGRTHGEHRGCQARLYVVAKKDPA